jgi:hypothetical protein
VPQQNVAASARPLRPSKPFEMRSLNFLMRPRCGPLTPTNTAYAFVAASQCLSQRMSSLVNICSRQLLDSHRLEEALHDGWSALLHDLFHDVGRVFGLDVGLGHHLERTNERRSSS